MQQDSVADDLELELKKLIVSSCNLEHLAPEDIESEEPLFSARLALDSIDALELGVALRSIYKLKIESVTEEIKRHFMNVRSLAQFIRSQPAD